jgi:hypothetical protein
MKRTVIRAAKRTTAALLLLPATTSYITVAQNGNTSTTGVAVSGINCNVPQSIAPLFELLNTASTLAFAGGVGLASVGLLISGGFYMMPGPDGTRKAKQLLKRVIVGTVILLSAEAILTFLIGELGQPFC